MNRQYTEDNRPTSDQIAHGIKGMGDAAHQCFNWIARRAKVMNYLHRTTADLVSTSAALNHLTLERQIDAVEFNDPASVSVVGYQTASFEKISVQRHSVWDLANRIQGWMGELYQAESEIIRHLKMVGFYHAPIAGADWKSTRTINGIIYTITAVDGVATLTIGKPKEAEPADEE